MTGAARRRSLPQSAADGSRHAHTAGKFICSCVHSAPPRWRPACGAAPALATGGGNDTSSKLRKAVTVDGIRVHQGAFSLAALVSGGNRLAGTKGYDYSADYVALRAKFAGLNVSRQDFEYDQLFFDWTPPKLEVKRGKRYMPEIFGSLRVLL